MAAAFQGHQHAVSEILRLTANGGNDAPAAYSDVNTNGEDALVLALANGHYPVARVLVRIPKFQTCKASTKGYCNALLDAAYSGDLEMVQFLLKIPSIQANVIPKAGWNALANAAQRGHLAVVEVLLQVESPGWWDVGAERREGKTLLRHAVVSGRSDVVRRIIRSTPWHHSNVGDNSGQSPLMEAASLGYLGVVDALLEIPSLDVNAVNSDRQTALMLAARKGHVDVVKALLSCRKTSIRVSDKAGNTALSLASMNQHTEVEKLLKVATAERANSIWKRLRLGS